MTFSNSIFQWHYPVAFSNAIFEWDFEMACSNGNLQRRMHFSTWFSNGIFQWHFTMAFFQRDSPIEPLNGISQCYFPMTSSNGIFECDFELAPSNAIFQWDFPMAFSHGIFQRHLPKRFFRGILQWLFSRGIFQLHFPVTFWNGMLKWLQLLREITPLTGSRAKWQGTGAWARRRGKRQGRRGTLQAQWEGRRENQDSRGTGDRNFQGQHPGRGTVQRGKCRGQVIGKKTAGTVRISPVGG